MKIINLIEDTPGSSNCLYEHGLSFYIETKKHKILMDTGASDTFIKNATQLGIDLKQVDIVVLSHGHYDHSGGILSFVKINPNATIYIQKNAGNDYYSIRENGPAYIGIDKKILLLSNIVYIDDLLNIDDELTIFSNITDRKFWPQTNQRLKKRENGILIQDDFDHEQCLVVNENNCSYLFSGCAHNGIVNILKRYDQIFKKYPDKIISGFHMIKKIPYDQDEITMIKETANILTKVPAVFYTGHCTGKEAFAIMKEIMGEQLVLIHSGMEIE